MERMTRFRAGVLAVLLVAVLIGYAFRLYFVQVIEPGGSTNNITTFETRTRVKAARGNILDTKGNVLVTNRASYDLTINHYVLTSSADPNGYLYRLAMLCKERGIEYIDHLPITKEAPFEYTLSEYNATWQNHFQAFLIYRDSLDSDIKAPLLMEKLRESYQIPREWSDEEARAVLGLRYELSLRNCVASLSNYVFLSDVDNDTLAAVLELNIPGMNVEASTVRQYNTPYAAHVLGHVSAMNAKQWEYYKPLGYSMDAMVGQGGFEEAFEPYLHGTDGTRVDVVTKDGTLVKSYYEVEPQAGQNVQVSIDLNLQTAAEDSMAITIEKLRDPEFNDEEDGRDAGGCAVVAMNVKTGQVLVCASYPTYDLSTLQENFNDLLSAELAPMFNRALQATYPPGSTYKMSMVVSGIMNDVIGKNSYIEDKGAFTKYPGFRANCLKWTSKGETHGSINAAEALQVSCNYFFYELADRMSIDAIDLTAKSLGLGELTGIELFEEPGQRANPETKEKEHEGTDDANWYTGDKILASIGQSENRFTPIQLCSYVNTLVNQGTRYKATFLDRVVSADYQSVVYENTVEVLSEYAVSDEAYDAYTHGMWLCANESGGTARKIFRDYPITVAAKTGTAQTGIQGSSDNGAFVCYAPYEDPEIVVAVYGEKAGHGSSLGEIARSVLDAYFNVDSPSQDVTPGENGIN